MSRVSRELEVVHEDAEFIVVNKPGGVLSVPGKGPEKLDCITERVKLRHSGCISHPAVHRLDMDTSGLMVVALTKDAQRELSRQFQDRETFKRYVAILQGIPEDDSGRMELKFRLDIDNRPIQIYDEIHGKVGITLWRKLAVESDRCRVEFIPITGRTHQLRVHSAHEKGLGIPIVGDPFYGDADGPGNLKLHASELHFDHPVTKKRLRFNSEPKF